MATRLPTIGKVRYSTSAYGLSFAFLSASAFSAVSPSARGVASTVAAGARYGSRYSRLTSCEAIHTTAANITSPGTGPSTNSTFRFIAPFISAPSFGPGGRGRGACLPFALELPHVRDDRPPVSRRDWPAVPGHQPGPVRDHVEDLPVRVLQNLFLMERSRGDV